MMFPRMKFLSILTLVFISTSLLANCTSFSGGTYTIAVVDSAGYSSSKPDAQSIYAGAKLAVDEFNSHSNGVKVKIESYADGSGTATSTAEKIVASPAVAVIGHSSNDTVSAVVPIYEKSKLPFMIVNPVQAQLTANNHYAFRVNYTAEQEAIYLATYLAKIQNQNKASIVYSGDQYGQALKKQFTNTFQGLGGEIILSENASENRIEDIVNDFVIARTGDPGVVFIATDDLTASRVLVQMKRKGVTYPIVGASALTRSNFIQLLNKEPEHAPYFVDGMLTIDSLVFDSADKYANQFLRNYQTAYSSNSASQIIPDDEVINGYNATLSILSAVQRARSDGESVDRAGVYDELSRMESPETGVQGITGPIYFNFMHNVARAPRFGVYQNGEIVSAMIQFDPIAAPEQLKPEELKDQVSKGRIMTVDGKYAYQANIVYAGVDIIGIQDVDIKTSTYKMDFYLWVRYRANSKDDQFLPADIVFSNAADSISMELVRPAETDPITGITTETYRVTGLFKNQFLFYEYPYDRQKLVIRFRNKNATTSFIQYVVDRIGMKDTGGTSLRDHFKDNGAYDALFGWNVQDAFAEQSIFSTTSTLGDPQNFGRKTSTEFSLINVGIDVQRASFQFIIKSLLPLLFTLILAYITFFLPLGHSERLGVGSTALLTTAFFHLNLASSLPEIGYTVAMEYFFYAAYVISALIVLLETVSIRIEKRGEETKSKNLKAELQKKRENLNVTGRILYPVILVATMLGGVAIQFGVLHLDPGKEASNSLVDKFLSEKVEQTQSAASTSEVQTNTLRLGAWRPEDTDQMQKLLQVFENKNKNVSIQYAPVMGANYDSILANQLESGSGPDLFFVHPYDTRVTQFLMPLNDLPIQDNFDASKSDPWKGSDGKYYALPYVGVVQGIYYNRDFFASHPNIPAPDTWQTWSDLIKYSQMIADTGKIPFANALNTSNDSEMFQSILVNFVGGPDGRERYATAEGKSLCFNSVEISRAFHAIEEIRPFILNSKFSPRETAKWTDDSISKQYFIDGKAVMLFGGSWDLQYFTDNAKFAWSVFAPPAPTGKTTYVIFQPDVGIGINNASTHKQEALAFLKWLMTDGVKATEENLPGRYLLINSKTTALSSATGHAGDFAKLTQFPSDIRWMFADVDAQYPRSSELIRSALYQIVTPDSSGNELSAKDAAQSLQAGLGEWYEPAQNCK